MRIYSRTGAVEINDPKYGVIVADQSGAFDVPDDMAERLVRFHTSGQPQWETDIDRQGRLMQEELDRRRDPASLLAAVEEIFKAAKMAGAATEAAAQTPDPPVAPTDRPKRGRSASARD